MKKLSTIIIAMALVLGLGQCKKQETPATTDPEDGLVYITVNVGDNGAKHEVYPNTGAYVFENNDVLYVGNNGHYIGTLTYNDGAFSGTIDSPSTTDYLHFFFVSGLGPTAEELEEASDPVTSFNVDISDQSSKLPILSYGHSSQKYTDGTATYSCMLENKCGLVKFVPSIATSRPITVSGMKTTATIDFSTGSITPAETTGGIKLHSESDAAKWAVLLQQDAVDEATVTISGFAASASVPTITNNYYNNSGVGISMTATCPEGAINGLFSVSADKQVYFSQGNLQYQASTKTWRFAERQIDYVGLALNGNVYVGEVQCDNALMSSTYSGWIDLFGWGTSGYNHGATYYQPWSTNSGNVYYYAYGLAGCNLYDQTGKADWGYNAISNGGNEENSGWRTLTNSEMDYVLNTRETTSGIRWAKGTVNGVNGVLLFPDDWSSAVYAMNVVNGGNYDSNIINAEDWATLLEPNGVVFLPYTGGIRRGTGNAESTTGAYFLSTYYDNGDAWQFGFNSTVIAVNYFAWRSDGRAVRLARNVQ